MRSSLNHTLISVALVAGLIFPPLAAYTSVYLTLLAMAIGLLSLSSQNWRTFYNGSFRFVGLTLVLLLLTLPAVFKTIDDIYIIFFLAPICLAPGIAMLLKEEPRFAKLSFICLLCLIGVGGAVAVALNDILVLRTWRVGGGNNPIHFGSLSLIIGFFAAIGVPSFRSSWRFLFLLGPVLASFAAALSGSRGTILALAFLCISVLPFLIYWFWRETIFLVSLLFATLAGLILFQLQVTPQTYGRLVSVLENSGTLYQEQNVTSSSQEQPSPAAKPSSLGLDGSTQQRLVLYSSAFEAFKESPLFGHGSGSFAQAAGKYMPDEYAGMRNSDHLHSDIADFAVIGGVVGLAAYFCLLAAPLFAFRGVKNLEVRRGVMIGGIILSGGYFSLGLTNAMFGILPQTTLYGVLLGVLVGIAQTADA